MDRRTQFVMIVFSLFVMLWQQFCHIVFVTLQRLNQKDSIMKKYLFMAFALLFAMAPSVAQNRASQVIAHRGYWKTEGSAQNSLTSLRKAHEIGVYGSEFDVHITRDGKLVVHHDDDIQGVNIEDADYSEIKNKRLGNGEKLPTLDAYLKVGKKLKGTQLILEIKKHKTEANEDRCLEAVLKMVKKMGMERQVEYISFSKHVCDQLVKLAPGAKISYLNGELSPMEAKQAGYTGIDYKDKVFDKHPEWIVEAKRLGLVTNVWTVNKKEEIKHFFDEGVDFVTTNEPVEAKTL